MTMDVLTIDVSFDRLVTRVAGEMVEVRFNRNVAFMSLPLVYPDGSFVTVAIRKGMNGYSVSDNGFAYRELEAIGRERAFGRMARRFAETEELFVSKRSIATNASEATLTRAVWDVAAASYQIAYQGFEAVEEVDEASIEDEVREKLSDIFHDAVIVGNKIVGASTAQWEVTAMVENFDSTALTVFQAVPNYAQSVYRTNAMFGDLMALDNPPNVVSVVRDQKEFGPRLNILHRAGRILELQATAERFKRAVAA